MSILRLMPTYTAHLAFCSGIQPKTSPKLRKSLVCTRTAADPVISSSVITVKIFFSFVRTVQVSLRFGTAGSLAVTSMIADSRSSDETAIEIMLRPGSNSLVWCAAVVAMLSWYVMFRHEPFEQSETA